MPSEAELDSVVHGDEREALMEVLDEDELPFWEDKLGGWPCWYFILKLCPGRPLVDPDIESLHSPCPDIHFLSGHRTFRATSSISTSAGYRFVVEAIQKNPRASCHSFHLIYSCADFLWQGDCYPSCRECGEPSKYVFNLCSERNSEVNMGGGGYVLRFPTKFCFETRPN